MRSNKEIKEELNEIKSKLYSIEDNQIKKSLN